MSQVVVITFDNPTEAGEVRESMRDLERQGVLDLEDSAVIVKDESGKVHVKNQTADSTKVGAFAGSMLGLLMMFMFPIAGLAIGAIAGGVIGSMLGQGVDKQFIKDVTAELKPGNSAIFLMVKTADPSAAVAALKPHTGKVFQTSLSSEAEETLRRTLKDTSAHS